MSGLPRIEPAFAVCEHEECIVLRWRNGDKSLAVWLHAEPNECLYHGLSDTEDIEFATVYAAYAWLVTP
jgi:hypothetical protein